MRLSVSWLGLITCCVVFIYGMKLQKISLRRAKEVSNIKLPRVTSKQDMDAKEYLIIVKYRLVNMYLDASWMIYGVMILDVCLSGLFICDILKYYM